MFQVALIFTVIADIVLGGRIFCIDNAYLLRMADGANNHVVLSDERIRVEQERIDQEKIAMQQNPGLRVVIQTSTNMHMSATFFDRGSKKLLIVGQGLGFSQEHMLFYARVFYDYDLLIFDYRWRDSIKFVLSGQMLLHPIAHLFEQEKEEVISVVRWGRARKQYEQIIGLGLCYSAYMFLAAQVESKKQGAVLFDALILDSCPVTIADVLLKFSNNPLLIVRPRQTHDPLLFRVLSWTYIPYMLAKFVGLFLPYSAISLCVELGQFPLMFIHGSADRLVPLADFNRLWDSVPSKNKVALITPSAHVMNIENNVIYKLVCDQFALKQ